jgi:hypothetical protein
MFAERHTIQLPAFIKPKPFSEPLPASAKTIAQQWINKLESVLQANDASQLPKLLHQNCWWRDMLALSWDFRTIHGLEKISEYLSENITYTTPHDLKLRESGKFAPNFNSPSEGITWLESMFDFQTRVGSGSGMLRLIQNSDGSWKGCMMYTALQDLKDFKENTGLRRAHGGNNSLVDGAIKGNWLERRQRQVEFVDEEPTVLIVGAGT